MDPFQALGLLEQLTPDLRIPLPQHRLVVQALGVLREAITPKPEVQPSPEAMAELAAQMNGQDTADVEVS